MKIQCQIRRLDVLLDNLIAAMEREIEKLFDFSLHCSDQIDDDR